MTTTTHAIIFLHSSSSRLSPHLYKTIPIHRKSTFNKFHRIESLAALARHHGQVIHVTCEFAQIWTTLPDHQCINFSTAEISDLQFQDYLDLTDSKNPAFSLKKLSIHINLYWYELDAFFRFLVYTPYVERFVAPTFAYHYRIKGLNGFNFVAYALLEHHRDTLEEIFDAMCTLEMESLDPEVLTRQRIGDAILPTAGMDAVASTIPWACSGLKGGGGVVLPGGGPGTTPTRERVGDSIVRDGDPQAEQGSAGVAFVCKLRQLHLRGHKNFIDKNTVREARRSWKNLG
ncbi:hypothetical protein EC957_007941 [Mortierella hygrophila]|uniref:Uncharacterized protein n=1 Tax=Mortierella hygrophila TaxID=979708 RepID=A0A9P6EWJ7_9FUNG|nr:hypothetical protein EC957_007941 [Mortierella hygrophila]